MHFAYDAVCVKTMQAIKKSLYRTKMRRQVVESALGKQRVSLGESGGFVRGKLEFPLTKVQETEIG